MHALAYIYRDARCDVKYRRTHVYTAVLTELPASETFPQKSQVNTEKHVCDTTATDAIKSEAKVVAVPSNYYYYFYFLIFIIAILIRDNSDSSDFQH